MSPRGQQDASSINRHTYIPPAAQAAMVRQMQQAVPAHLKQYMGTDRPAYVPDRVQQELTAQMKKVMPAHLQEYAGAYVQQNIVDPGMRTPLATHATTLASPPPRGDRLNQTHSGSISSEQQHARFLNLFQPDAAPGKPSQPMVLAPGETYDQKTPPAQKPQSAAAPPPVVPIPGRDPLEIQPQQLVAPQQQPTVDHSPYEFIMDPVKPRKPSVSLPGGSTAKRALLFGGGLVVLIIAVSVILSLLKGTPTTAPLITVVQEQTELARVANAGSTTTTNPTTQAFATAVAISAASATKQVTTYMATNKEKLDPKLLGLKQSATVDSELQTAQTNNSYDATLVKVLEDDLASYSQALQTAYKANPGPKGRQMLSSQYDGAQLLIEQGKQIQS